VVEVEDDSQGVELPELEVTNDELPVLDEYFEVDSVEELVEYFEELLLDEYDVETEVSVVSHGVVLEG